MNSQRGVIHLPTSQGGYLSFKFWNDQPKGQSWTLNKLNLTIGSKKEALQQYTPSMDLEDCYREDQGWGPSGGRTLTFSVPSGTGLIEVREGQSDTSIELSDLRFVGNQ